MNLITTEEFNRFLLKNKIYLSGDEFPINEIIKNTTLEEVFKKFQNEVLLNKIKDIFLSSNCDIEKEEAISCLCKNFKIAKDKIFLFEGIKKQEKRMNRQVDIKDLLEEYDFSVNEYDSSEKEFEIETYTSRIGIDHIFYINIGNYVNLTEKEMDKKLFKELKKYTEYFDIDEETQIYIEPCKQDGYSIKTIYEDLEEVLNNLNIIVDVYENILRSREKEKNKNQEIEL